MKPESADYQSKARRCSSGAQIVADAELHPVAAREAYLAAFHAAHACIFEQTGKAANSHRGVRSELVRLAKSDRRLDQDLLNFLANDYEYKFLADYRIGGQDHKITAVVAASAIETAQRFVNIILC